MATQNCNPPPKNKNHPNRSLDEEFEWEVARMSPARLRIAAHLIAALRDHRRIWVRVIPDPVRRVHLVTARGITEFPS